MLIASTANVLTVVKQSVSMKSTLRITFNFITNMAPQIHALLIFSTRPSLGLT